MIGKDSLSALLSMRTLDNFQRSAADYAAHGFAVGKYELSAFAADLGLNLKVYVLRG